MPNKSLAGTTTAEGPSASKSKEGYVPPNWAIALLVTSTMLGSGYFITRGIQLDTKGDAALPARLLRVEARALDHPAAATPRLSMVQTPA